MSKNMGNSQPIGYIFTHSWNKNACVKNTENPSNKSIDYNEKA